MMCQPVSGYTVQGAPTTPCKCKGSPFLEIDPITYLTQTGLERTLLGLSARAALRLTRHTTSAD